MMRLRSISQPSLHQVAVSRSMRPVCVVAAAQRSEDALWQRITDTYSSACSTGAISSIPAKLTHSPLQAPSNPVHAPPLSSSLSQPILAAPATATRTESSSAAAEPPPPPARNPFLPYEPQLFVSNLSPTHLLLLNKFNVVEHHLLVVTRQFESQADPLNGRDLGGAWDVLQTMPDGGVAFYNCGPASGRSQPHKHMQVVPLPFMEGQEAQAPVHALVLQAARQAADAPGVGFPMLGLPYQCYAALLPHSCTPAQLESTFQSLYKTGKENTGSPTQFSYNVLLTRSWMMLVPRKAESAGPCSVNALGFAGTILVKSDEECAFVKEVSPCGLLQQLAFAWPVTAPM